MHLRARGSITRRLAVIALAMAWLVPVPSVAAAEDGLTLIVGTDQEFSGLNPWQAVYVVDYEVFTLNYDLLVGYDENLAAAPGFAESWTTSTDGKTTTFKIRSGMLWSDGQPATAEDARWTYQLVIDAKAQDVTLGSGYIDGYLASAGLTAVSAPDAQTLVVETATATPLLLSAYVPILPKHIWEGSTIDQIANTQAEGYFANNPPVVGTGPYVAVEFVPGQSIRFVRNENYWGRQGAADEVIIQHFEGGETMVQALRNGEIDYARGVGADAFDALEGAADIETVEGFANGYSYLTFNGYTKPIAGGGASTTAVADPAFRDAVAYALDLPELVDRVLAGHGTPGTSLVPPFHAQWYVPPAADALRSFDLAEAGRRLEAAGYMLDAQNRRLDKEGEPINLRLTWPASEPELATVADFIRGWWGELGIGIEASVTEDDTLLVDLTPPEYDPPGVADFDIYMWGWVGDVDPNSLLQPFITDEIGGSSDTFYSNPEFDALFVQQSQTTDVAARKALLQQMQEMFYRDAPNVPLYFDSELHAYRTDKFGGWQNQPPDTGTPLFGFGPLGYTLLTVAGETPSPSAGASGPAASGATPAPSGAGTPAGGSANNTLLIVVIAIAAVAAAGLALAMRRRRSAAEEE